MANTAANQPKPKKKPSTASREAEAVEGHVTTEYCGVTLRIPVGGKIPIAAIDAFRVGDNYEGTKQLLGEDQWRKLSEAGMTLEDLDKLAEELDELQGK